MEKQYFLYDYETGTPILVSKETKERHDNMMRRFHDEVMSKIGNIKGTILLIGTGGELERGDIKELFYKPESFNIL